MGDQVKPKNTKPPPLWGPPKPGQEPVLGTCARCSRVVRLLSEMSPNNTQDTTCGSCGAFNATNVKFKEME